MPMGQINGTPCFGQGSDLIDLNQNGVGGPLVQTLLQTFDVCDKQIIPHQLQPVAQRFG